MREMEHWMPNEVFGWLKRIPRAHWCGFAGVWVAGLFAHGYMLANKLPNHDDLHSLFGKGALYEMGRWGLPYVGRLDGNYSMPWMLGLLTLFLLAVTAMLLVELLQIQSPLFGALAGGILAVFPTVTCLFSYMFTSFAYAISILLSVLAAWLARRKSRWWLIPAVLCIIGSLSIYQAFLGFAAALMVYGLYAASIREDADPKRILISGVWQAGTLAAGVAGYLLITRWMLARHEASLTGYMYMDQMGEIHPSLIPGQVLDAYRLFFGLEPLPRRGIATTGPIRDLLALCTLLLTVLVLAGILQQVLRKRWAEAGLALLLAGMFPVAANLIFLMHTSSVHTLMVYPMCMLPLSLLARCDAWCAGHFPKGRAGLVRLLGSWAVTLCVGLLCLRYGMLANEAYLRMQLNQTQRLSYWTGIVTQIRSLPGYDPALPVALIGEDNEDPNLSSSWRYSDLNGMVGTDMAIREPRADTDFLRYYLAYAPRYADESAVRQMEGVDTMPCYPAEGSIRILDGVIVVKLSNT